MARGEIDIKVYMYIMCIWHNEKRNLFLLRFIHCFCRHFILSE